jgi:hypothetical protein
MDLSKVEKDETKRQRLIEQQKGNGIYNPKTGVYKWGTSVYDFTKTNGEIGLGWMPMRGKILSYNAT